MKSAAPWPGEELVHMAGFIHDKLDIKLLVLYILDRAAAAIDFATLTDLSIKA